MQNRRDFLKTTSTACAALAGLGFLTTLESCSSSAAVTASSYDAATNKISLPLSAFGTNNKLVIGGPGGDYNIFVSRASETEVTALQLKCTHRGHGVKMEEAKLHCPMHGSEFDFSGNVTNGPAKLPLKKFPVTIENGNVVILIA